MTGTYWQGEIIGKKVRPLYSRLVSSRSIG